MEELKKQYSKLSNEALMDIVYNCSNYKATVVMLVNKILEERGVICLPSGTILKSNNISENSARPVSKYTDVGGWLLFFCVTLVILNPLGAIAQFATATRDIYTAIDFFGDAVTIVLTLFGIYAGILLWKIRPNAVKIAKRFLVINIAFHFLVGALIFLMGIEADIVAVFSPAGYFILWYSYLKKSDRVKMTYGPLGGEKTVEDFSKQVVSESIVCPHCGVDSELDATFCIQCGKSLGAVESNVSSPDVDSKYQAGIIWPRLKSRISPYVGWRSGLLIALCLVVIVLIVTNIPPSPSAIFVREKNKIVSITSSGGLLNSPVSGTGFVVGSSGQILTNYHVIRGANKCSVKFFDNEVYDISGVLAVDKVRDIVLLKISAADLSVANLGNSDTVKTGHKCYVIGNPMGIERVISDGIISNIVGGQQASRLIQITAPISHGNSGGPVYDKKGKIIGIVNLSISEGQNLNFAIPINYAKGLMTNGKESISMKDFTKNDAHAYISIGLEEFGKDNRNRAIQYLYKAYDIDPSQTMSCFGMGMIYYLQDDYSSAKSWLQHYVELENKNSDSESLVQEAKDIIRGIDLYERESNIRMREHLLQLYERGY